MLHNFLHTSRIINYTPRRDNKNNIIMSMLPFYKKSDLQTHDVEENLNNVKVVQGYGNKIVYLVQTVNVWVVQYKCAFRSRLLPASNP